MRMYPCIRLKKNEERRLLAGHLWIYSNEIDVQHTPLNAILPGALVRIESYRGQFLGIGYCHPHTLLSARLLSRKEIPIDTHFFADRLKRALQLREWLFQTPFYRVVFGESDGIPGLVIDRFDSTYVFQISTCGVHKLKQEIIQAAHEILHPKTLVFRAPASTMSQEKISMEPEIIGDPLTEHVIIENDSSFQVDLTSGQKTGWFYDQRNIRTRMRHYVKNKRVLDVFSYIGAFGIQAAKASAREVVCVDSSLSAHELLKKNAELNGVENMIKPECVDAFEYLKQLKNQKNYYDVIILDPPAFIKKRKDHKSGSIAYQRLSELALKILNKNGILITCSCSMHFSLEQLKDCIRRAAIETRSELQILEQHIQAPDHPIHPAIPETLYLKALIIHKSSS